MRKLLPWLCSLVACSGAPPPPAPAPAAASAPAASSAPPPAGPLPALSLRWRVQDDFVHALAERIEPRPFDAAAVAAALPAPLGKALVEAASAPAKGEARGEAQRTKGIDEALGKLEKRAREARGAGATAAWLGAGWLAERWQRPGKAGSWQERALAAYAAAAAAPLDDPLGRQGRYRLALLQGRTGKGDRGRAALDALSSHESDLQPEAAARLGALLGEGAEGDAERSAEAYRRGLGSQVPTGAAARGALVQGLMLASYRQERFEVALDEALDFLRGFRGTGAPTAPVDGALRIAADSIERLGVDGPLDRAASAPLDEALLRVAWRAVRREDFALAERVAGHVLDASPLSWNAPSALRTLISAADGKGERALADERRARLSRDFGAASPWAEAQRAARAPDGWPPDTALASAVKAPPVAAPNPADERLRSRGQALVRLCLEPDAWRLPAARVSLAVEVRSDGAVSPAEASVEPAGPAAERVARCLRALAPAHLAGAPASLRASASYGGSGEGE